MRKITVILHLLSGTLCAQQYSLPTQIERNQMYVNPAYAGLYEAAVASLMHRSQWVGVPGALSFQSFELHAPLNKQAMALGLQARNESIGLKNNTEAFLTYAFRIRMDKSTLAFALKAGGQSIRFQEADLKESDEIDYAFLNNSTFLPNGGFGLSFYSTGYFVGLSIPYFFGALSTSDGSAQLDFDMERLAYVLSGGGSFSLNQSVTFEPVGAVYYSMSLKPQVTAVLNFKWQESVLLGAGYRLNEGIIINAGYYINRQFSIGYSYDYNIGNIGPYSSGSHELGIVYFFGYKVNTINPRDF